MLRYMLDTDICIYVIKKRPESIRLRFNDDADRLSISAVTLAELLYGVEKSAKPAENLQAVQAFTARLDVLPFTDRAASHFGQIRAALERVGRPIGAYDLMIAGHARSEGLVLVTNNVREFKRVEGIVVENWLRA